MVKVKETIKEITIMEMAKEITMAIKETGKIKM